jgi:hypothetical protein
VNRAAGIGVAVVLIGCGLALLWPGLSQGDRISILTAFLTFVAVAIALLSAVYAQQAAFLARQTALEQRLERRLEKLQRLAPLLRELQTSVISGAAAPYQGLRDARQRLNDEMATFPIDLLPKVRGVGDEDLKAEIVKQLCPDAIKELESSTRTARQQLAAAENAF